MKNITPVSTPTPLSKEQIAVFLGISLATVDRLIRTGVLPAVKVGKLVRVNKDDLDTYLISCKKTN